MVRPSTTRSAELAPRSYSSMAGSCRARCGNPCCPSSEATSASLRRIVAVLGVDADRLKSMHPAGDPQWRELVEQTARMWLDYEGLTDDEIVKITAPTLVFTGDRDEEVVLDLMVSLYRTLPNAELGVCASTDHSGPIRPERAGMFATMIRDFAGRH